MDAILMISETIQHEICIVNGLAATMDEILGGFTCKLFKTFQKSHIS